MSRDNTVGIAVIAMLLLLGISALAFWKSKGSTPETASDGVGLRSAELAAIEPQVIAFCGDCHATPSPSSFPRDGWFHEVERGYDFYYTSGRSDLAVPPKRQVTAYYRSLAPERLALPTALPPISERLQFRKMEVDLDGAPDTAPAIAHLGWFELDKPILGVCDMRSGFYWEISLRDDGVEVRRRLELRNPAHSVLTDLDGDGNVDRVVADLGSFLPEDHDRGRVLWLTQLDSPEPRVVELATGLGRVADVRPIDVDADGDIDLVVAEFGYLKTGRIVLLENTGMQDGIPRFDLRVLDPRHGSIHVPTVDFNGDGREDFVALISQEHEVVELFLNEGADGFQKTRLFAADDPSFGSSGIEIVDLDQDGDYDIVYTNGDTLDSFYLKPYHAIHWLENRGDDGWRDHILTEMPGVVRALPGDMDGDGDIDLVAVAFIPDELANDNTDVPLDSVIWLEQREDGKFVRHALEKADCRHAALAVADFDGDGDFDLAVGNFSRDSRPDLTIWWNETAARKSVPSK